MRLEELRAAGRDASPAVVCAEADCPELVEELAAQAALLQALDGRIQSTHPVKIAGDAPPLSAPSAPINAAARYEQLDYLAAGGLGVVYRAQEQHELNGGHVTRRVAIKFIKPDVVGDADTRARFEREAEVTGRLDHPGVIPVYNMGVDSSGCPFYAMRFIEGDSLARRIDLFHSACQAKANNHQQRLQLSEMLRHLISAARTVAYAHHRGVAHLDLKDEHVMIGAFGETLVVDWGLAIAVNEKLPYRLTFSVDQVTGLLDTNVGPSASGIGTLPYMSPEQCDETWGSIGPASDIYALGVTLYRVLTGRLPFSGFNFLRDYREPKKLGRFLRPTQVRRGVPKPLEAICLKAMAPRQEDRYVRASEFAADLEAWIADEPVSVYREPLTERLLRTARRNRSWSVSLGAAVLLCLAMATLASWLLALRADREREAHLLAQQAEQRATQALHTLEAVNVESLRSAARFAARTIAGEIDRRMRFVESKASSPKLIALLSDAIGQPRNSEPRLKLQAWIEQCKRTSSDIAAADSWYITDHKGIQLARVELSETTIDKWFGYRDYFHGQGVDRPADERIDFAPIRTPYLSNVFVSESNHHRMVAFSVPIWSDPAKIEPDIQPLGILALTVDMEVLRIVVGDRHTAVLADLREDVLEGKQNRQRGLILFHPQLNNVIAEQVGGIAAARQAPRLPPEHVQRFQDLGQRRLSMLAFDPKIDKDLEGSLIKDHVDPLSPAADQERTAVVEPVIIPWRRDEPRLGDTGWVIIVHQ